MTKNGQNRVLSGKCRAHDTKHFFGKRVSGPPWYLLWTVTGVGTRSPFFESDTNFLTSQIWFSGIQPGLSDTSC